MRKKPGISTPHKRAGRAWWEPGLIETIDEFPDGALLSPTYIGLRSDQKARLRLYQQALEAEEGRRFTLSRIVRAILDTFLDRVSHEKRDRS